MHWVRSTSILALAACAEASSATSTPSPATPPPGCDVVVPPGPDDPNARSVDGIVFSENGLPVPGARVSVGGQVAVTGPSGAFGFRDVGVPYDLIVRDGPVVNAFVGLARQHVVVHTTLLRSPREWSAHVVTAFPPAPAVLFLAEGTEITSIEPEPGGVIVRWTGGYSRDVVLYAVAYDADPATRLPSRYIGQASFRDQLLPDALTTWQSAFSPVDTAAMALTPRVPLGYAQTSFDFTLDLGGPAQAALGPFAGSPPAILLPVLPFAGVHVHAVAAQGDATSRFATPAVLVTTPAVDMPFAVAPSLLSPADLSVGSRARATDEFSWTAPPGGANQLFLEPEAAGDPTLVVTTSATTARVDGAALGAAFPRGAVYRWKVRHRADTPGGVDQLSCPGFDERATRTATSARRTWVAPP